MALSGQPAQRRNQLNWLLIWVILNTILQPLFYKLQYNMYAVTSPTNNFAIT